MYSDWTTQFFGGLAVEFWVNVAPTPTDEEIDFLRSIFRDGKELLDVACGAGRFTIPLATAGYRLTGIDISEDFLDVARRRDYSIEWIRGDIRELPWSARFDGALCFGNSFAYFPRQDTMRFLRGVSRALRPRAAFVLETAVVAESLLPSFRAERAMTVGDIEFRSTARYEVKRSRFDTQYTFKKGERVETKDAHTWVFTTADVIDMLEISGFALEDVYSSASRDPFTLGSPRAIFVTHRQNFSDMM